MIESKAVINNQVEAVMGRLAELDRGDVIGLEEIETITGVRRYSLTWNSVIRRVKNAMLDGRGVALWPVVAVGYRLCTEDEQINMVSVKRQRRAIRQLSRTDRELSSMPTDGLTDHQIRVRAVKIQNVVLSRRLIKRQVREQKIIGRRTETVPSVGAGMQKRREAGAKA